MSHKRRRANPNSRFKCESNGILNARIFAADENESVFSYRFIGAIVIGAKKKRRSAASGKKY